VKVLSIIVIVPVREEALWLAATEYTAVLVPDPDPVVTVTQLSLLRAVHTQPLPAVTATVPIPPLASKDCWVG
jgi:hypothetical protein